MSDFEERLTEVLARKSADAPPINGLVEQAQARHRRRRRTVVSGLTTVAVAAALAFAVVLPEQNNDPGVPGPAGSPTEPTSPIISPTTTVTPDCAELTGPHPPVSAAPIPRVPDQDAKHTTFNESGTVAAWFNQSDLLPELVVFDLTKRQELAREDLGVGEVAAQPSLRIFGQSLYFRTAADPNVWMRYAWNEDGYPQVYKTCN